MNPHTSEGADKLEWSSDEIVLFHQFDPYRSVLRSGPAGFVSPAGQPLPDSETSYELLRIAVGVAVELQSAGSFTDKTWKDHELHVREVLAGMWTNYDFAGVVTRRAAVNGLPVPDKFILGSHPSMLLTDWLLRGAPEADGATAELRTRHDLWCLLSFVEIDQALSSAEHGNVEDVVRDAVRATEALANAKALASKNLPFTSFARSGGLARHAKSPQHAAKKQVNECWIAWQKFPDRYKSKARFALDMLDKFPALTSPRVVEDWCRKWEAELQ